MAEGKKGFLLYADYKSTFDLLTDEQAGKLIKHLLEYVNDKNPEFENDELLLRIAFEPIKLQLKRDLKDWEEARRKRSEAGHLGGIKSAESRRLKQSEANEAQLEKLKQGQASPSKTKRTQANQAVNVNVNVNDTVTDIEKNIISVSANAETRDEANQAIVGVKKNSLPKKKVPPKKKGKNPDSEPYWALIRKKWVWFNKTHLKFSVEPIPDRDYSHMHRIIEKLKARAVDQNIEWTESNALTRWEKFLSIAYTKDDWLHDNFLLGNLESKMQKVFNLIDNPNGQHTKTARQRSTTSSVGKTIEFDRP